MRVAVIYSSLTGNTRMVAEAIHRVMPQGAEIFPVAEAPAPTGYDFLALGFWVDRGQPNSAMRAYMEQIQGQNVGLFGTLGAWPDSDHARQTIAAAEALVEGNTVLGSFLCQGKVNPKLLAMMAKKTDSQASHPMTAEREARIEEAKKHPNADDCATAQQTFLAMLDRVNTPQ